MKDTDSLNVSDDSADAGPLCCGSSRSKGKTPPGSRPNSRSQSRVSSTPGEYSSDDDEEYEEDIKKSRRSVKSDRQKQKKSILKNTGDSHTSMKSTSRNKTLTERDTGSSKPPIGSLKSTGDRSARFAITKLKSIGGFKSLDSKGKKGLHLSPPLSDELRYVHALMERHVYIPPSLGVMSTADTKGSYPFRICIMSVAGSWPTSDLNETVSSAYSIRWNIKCLSSHPKDFELIYMFIIIGMAF